MSNFYLYLMSKSLYEKKSIWSSTAPFAIVAFGQHLVVGLQFCLKVPYSKFCPSSALSFGITVFQKVNTLPFVGFGRKFDADLQL